jgi:hypothetical protein
MTFAGNLRILKIDLPETRGFTSPTKQARQMPHDLSLISKMTKLDDLRWSVPSLRDLVYM